MPKYLVRGWINFVVTAKDREKATELVCEKEVLHPHLDNWDVDEVELIEEKV